MSQQKLEGGFVNNVHLVNGYVDKQFVNDGMVGIPSEVRMKREMLALEHFGHVLAPAFIGIDGNHLYQEFIHGINFEKKAQNKECDFQTAGSLLRGIHTSVSRPFIYTKNAIINKIIKDYQKANPVLQFEGLTPEVNINWDTVEQLGTTRVHRDYWLGNIIQNGGDPKVIDWEFSGIGSPYEDFAIAELWIFREYGGEDEFWRGYGMRPDKDTTIEFMKARCLTALGTVDINNYYNEENNGFYHNKINILRSLQ